ncbi:MAG: hypothetical protein KJ971_08575 [Firmicutes bacterium]|nr:hypothetical protein [Bacillota bacterium]
MLFSTYEAAATLTAGTDAFRNERKRTSGRLRQMTGVAIVGGNAINEAAVDIYIEDYFVGQFRNSKSGVSAIDAQADIKWVGKKAIPPGSQVAAIIATAPTVSPLLIEIHGKEY